MPPILFFGHFLMATAVLAATPLVCLENQTNLSRDMLISLFVSSFAQIQQFTAI
jgi:hypothetical protein